MDAQAFGAAHRVTMTGTSSDTRKIIDMLGAAGKTEIVQLLHTFTDDQALRRAAIDAIKQLTDHRT
jgi:hypothetical protein